MVLPLACLPGTAPHLGWLSQAPILVQCCCCHNPRPAAPTLHPSELAAEKEVLRRQAAVRAAPADDLRRLQERLAL